LVTRSTTKNGPLNLRKETDMQIRIDTEHTREVGRQLTAQGGRLSEIGHELQHAIGRLDTWAWDGASRWRAEPLLSRVRPESGRLSEQLGDLGQQLIRISEALEGADSTSAAGVEAIPWFALEPVSGWRTNPTLRLGTLLTGGGGVAALTLTTLPITGTEGRVSFVDRLAGIPDTIREWLSPAVDTVARWLGWDDLISDQPVAPAPWEDFKVVEVLAPGETLEGTPTPTLEPLPRATEEITSAVLPSQVTTPTLKQTAGSYECAPTAAGMVLEYFHAQDPNLQTRTPQELIQGLGGHFNSQSGISASELVDGLKEMDLGYQTIQWQASLDQQGLQTELKGGPVLAQVHLNWDPNSYPHMVTVTGMSEGGGTVYVNDPWTGRASEIAWSTFEKSWSFNGRYKDSSHLIVKIRP
jgi:uncharacterized protein YukE